MYPGSTCAYAKQRICSVFFQIFRCTYQLWEEKLKLAPPFKGNEATNWGTNQEAAAIDDYVAITRRGIRKETFRTYGPPSVSGWYVAYIYRWLSYRDQYSMFYATLTRTTRIDSAFVWQSRGCGPLYRAYLVLRSS